MVKQIVCLYKLSIDHKNITLSQSTRFVLSKVSPGLEMVSIFAIFVRCLRNPRTFFFCFMRSKIFMTTLKFYEPGGQTQSMGFFYFLFKFLRIIKIMRLAVKCLSVEAFWAEHCPEITEPSFLPPSFYHKNEPQNYRKCSTKKLRLETKNCWFPEV